MIRQQFLLLLMLTMVITPVSSAFGYYSSRVNSLSAESSFDQSIAAIDSTDAAPQHSEHCLQQDKFKTACHASGSCTFHVCGDGGIAAVFLLTQVYSPYRYEHWEKSVSHSLSFSPEIRPPINSL
ncbi:MAG: hypothetical protein WC762_01830 [Methylobacter sp.]|jgi:hypothetical protein